MATLIFDDQPEDLDSLADNELTEYFADIQLNDPEGPHYKHRDRENERDIIF